MREAYAWCPPASQLLLLLKQLKRCCSHFSQCVYMGTASTAAVWLPSISFNGSAAQQLPLLLGCCRRGCRALGRLDEPLLAPLEPSTQQLVLALHTQAESWGGR